MKTVVPSVSVRISTDPDSLLEEWDDLAGRVGTVFSSRPGFVLGVARATRLNCVFVSARRGDRLVAVAPLSLVRRGPVALAKVVGAHLGVPLEFLSEDAEASDSLLDAVAAQGWMLSADSMISDDLTVTRLLQHPSWTVDAQVREHVPVIALEPGETAANVRGAKSLKRLRQYRSKVSRQSSYRVEEITDVAHLDSRWNDIVRVATDAVEGTDKVNYLVSPHGEFAHEFLRGEARAGRLCIAGLVIGGAWTAHEIGIRTKGRMEGWLTHYDDHVGKWQPGHQLIEWFADNHDDLGVSELDQGVGVNEIKSVWAKSGYDVLRVSAAPSRWTFSTLLTRALRSYSPVVACVRGTAIRLLQRLGLNR